MSSPTTSIDLCQDIVSKQRESLERFFDTFQCEDTWVLAEKILNHQGSIFFLV
ncbi:sugar-phosphate isomerase-like domain protein [Chlamydia psittaci VS225]|nr:sugar-phosphate isomerase-like domain protein [Chlamydia psittaci VS225]